MAKIQTTIGTYEAGIRLKRSREQLMRLVMRGDLVAWSEAGRWKFSEQSVERLRAKEAQRKASAR